MFGKLFIAQKANNVAGEIKCVTCGLTQPSRQKLGMGWLAQERSVEEPLL